MDMSSWLRWGTPILAAITALLEAGHEGNLFSSEALVLIFAILTAISSFTIAVTSPREETKQTKQEKPPPQPQPQKK